MKLLEPIVINGMRVPNRVMVPAMVTRLSGEDGFVTQAISDRYVRYAQGEVGLIVVEAMAIHGSNAGPLLRIGDDKFIPGLKEMNARIHGASESKVVPQLIHFMKISRSGWRQTVDMLALEEIDRIVEQFGQAAARAREAGFDGIELHNAHGYTLASFVSSANTRTDEYGGTTLENRLRLIGRVMDSVRRYVGHDFPVGIRYLADEFIRDGYTVEDAKLIGLRMAQLGADYLSLSVGGKFEDAVHTPGHVLHAYSGYSGDRCMPGAKYPPALHLSYAEQIRAFVRGKGFDVPIIAAGKLSDPKVAEEALASGKLDMVAIARGLLADPDWVRKLRLNAFDRVVECDYCNVCKQLDGAHMPVTCFLWPKGAKQAPAADDAAATEHLGDLEVRDLIARLEAATERIDTVPPELAAEAAATTEALERLAAEADTLAAELVDYDETLMATYARQEQACRAGLAALDSLAATERALDDASSALSRAVVAAGFTEAAEAVAAALDQRAYDRLAATVAEHDRRLAAVTAVLAEPGADEVAAAVLPDLDELEREHRDTLEALGAARAQEAAWAARASRLARLVTELDAALADWRPLREELELTTRLCSFVEGKAADNRLQMRLSAYVLAYRLSQVVAAANERLGRMSDQRFSLEHTGRRGAGETRGGLSLLVRDDWSGEARDPATLSGGETFVVSLALALGLADVVTQEAGGAELDTLFVDEGFGALDADTLDDVMDTLDSLRDGGRVVGVVSHVAEMRDRIPTRLVVSKSRRGSTLAINPAISPATTT